MKQHPELDIFQRIQRLGLIPVIQMNELNQALPLAEALCKGGLPAAEITFRTPCAGEAIKRVKRAFPHMLIGAGTVLTTSQADQAVENWAEFIVSPGLNPKVARHCIEKGYPVLPGCATPSEVEQALELGLNIVKFFPAEAAGGLPMIKAMAAPYSQVRFMPTGGICGENLPEYLACDKVLACGGSFMVPKDLLNRGDYDGIARLTKKAIDQMLSFRLEKITLPALAESLPLSLLGWEAGVPSFAQGNSVSMQTGGERPEMVISTPDAERAAFYLAQRGAVIRETSIITDQTGRISSFFLEQAVSGFAITVVKG